MRITRGQFDLRHCRQRRNCGRCARVHAFSWGIKQTKEERRKAKNVFVFFPTHGYIAQHYILLGKAGSESGAGRRGDRRGGGRSAAVLAAGASAISTATARAGGLRVAAAEEGGATGDSDGAMRVRAAALKPISAVVVVEMRAAGAEVVGAAVASSRISVLPRRRGSSSLFEGRLG